MNCPDRCHYRYRHSDVCHEEYDHRVDQRYNAALAREVAVVRARERGWTSPHPPQSNRRLVVLTAALAAVIATAWFVDDVLDVRFAPRVVYILGLAAAIAALLLAFMALKRVVGWVFRHLDGRHSGAESSDRHVDQNGRRDLGEQFGEDEDVHS